MIREEVMGPQFRKLHLDVGKFPITLHHFSAPDVGDPHDHPLPFTTTILRGGYVEEVWRFIGGRWCMHHWHRRSGTSHTVAATDIHRIIELPHGECVTSVVWHEEGEVRREPRFHRLVDGVMLSRQWNETEFA